MKGNSTCLKSLLAVSGYQTYRKHGRNTRHFSSSVEKLAENALTAYFMVWLHNLKCLLWAPFMHIPKAKDLSFSSEKLSHVFSGCGLLDNLFVLILHVLLQIWSSLIWDAWLSIACVIKLIIHMWRKIDFACSPLTCDVIRNKCCTLRVHDDGYRKPFVWKHNGFYRISSKRQRCETKHRQDRYVLIQLYMIP